MERDDHLVLLTRLALWPLAMLSAIFGPMLFLLPSRTDTLWSWQIRPDMSAVFVGAGYIFGACAITTLLIRNQWHALNTAALATWVSSVAMLAATLLHLDRFFVGTLRFYVWFVIYLALPFALPAAWVLKLRFSKPHDPGDLVFDAPIRYANLLLGLVLLGFGLFLFFDPAGAAAIWPWQLTPLMSQVISGWIMFLGMGGIVIFFEPRYSAYRALIPGTLVWDIALLVGARLHRNDFDFTHTSSLIWLIVLILFTLGNIAALARYEPLYRRRRPGSTAPATA
jgi:hypothetical protein